MFLLPLHFYYFCNIFDSLCLYICRINVIQQNVFTKYDILLIMFHFLLFLSLSPAMSSSLEGLKCSECVTNTKNLFYYYWKFYSSLIFEFFQICLHLQVAWIKPAVQSSLELIEYLTICVTPGYCLHTQALIGDILDYKYSQETFSEIILKLRLCNVKFSPVFK